MIVWRVEFGQLLCSYSYDGGNTFKNIDYMMYDGTRKIRNPRGSIGI